MSNQRIDPYPVQPHGRGCTGPVILAVQRIMKSRMFVFLLAVVFLSIAGVATFGIFSAVADGRSVHPLFWVFTPFLFVVGGVTLRLCIKGSQTENDKIKKIMESTLTGP